MAASSQNRLSLFSLPTLVIDSMIGAGLFSLPITFAIATGRFGAISWCVAASGMVSLARVFQSSPNASPISVRASTPMRGPGDYPGFLSAFVTARSHAAWQRKNH
jgi:arginine:ornithine antiporter / lysine permease